VGGRQQETCHTHPTRRRTGDPWRVLGLVGKDTEQNKLDPSLPVPYGLRKKERGAASIQELSN